MDPDRYRRAMELFDRACNIELSHRNAFLDSACGNDPALRAEVESLLAHDEQPYSAIYRGADGALVHQIVQGDELDSPDLNIDLGRPSPQRFLRIGRYRIIRLIGSGGMGTVYEAEQTLDMSGKAGSDPSTNFDPTAASADQGHAQPTRTVALKIVRPELASPTVRRRFSLEAQVLGHLHHPGIAQIYEAGIANPESAGEGHAVDVPFFAMELIAGCPIDGYARERSLSLRQRLELTAMVCDAVHHAHQKGVIHRDLKPGNILVDEHGQPKVLDFGVARVTDAGLNAAAGATLHTGAGLLIGTLSYMGPEQISGLSDEVDTRSDVYALGVLLYELLAGRLPFDLRNCGLTEAARLICETDAPRLGIHSSGLRGDVETIVATAMAKDKSQRYGSAADLAADIRRYLKDEPVVAHAASWAYLLRKFVRRHRAIVAGISATLLTLLAGLIATGWFALKSERERTAAVMARDQAREVQRFLEVILASATPSVAAGRDTTILREMLAEARKRSDLELASQPEVAASVHCTIGQTYLWLGDAAESERQLQKAYDIQLPLLGIDHDATVRTASALGVTLNTEGKLKEAEPLLRRALEHAERNHPDEHADVLISLSNLASLCGKQGRRAEAETLYRRAIAAHRKRGTEDNALWYLMSNLGTVRMDAGDYAEAESFCREALNGFRRDFGNDHPQTLFAMNQLSATLIRQKRWTEAEAILQEAVATGLRIHGPDHPHVLGFLNNLAAALKGQEKQSESEAVYRRMIPVAERVLGANHPNTLTIQNNLGETLVRLGRPAEAEPILRSLMEHAGSVRRDNLARFQRNYGLCLLALERYDEAESQLLKGHESFNESLGPVHEDTRLVIENLIDLYKKWERPESVIAWQAKLKA